MATHTYMTEAQAEAYNRQNPTTLQLRPFTLTIHHTPTKLETAFYGTKATQHTVTVWGFTALDAEKRWRNT